MSEAEAAPDQDRLPWLGEEAERPREHRTRDAVGLAIVAALLIFGVSYWIASQNWQRERAQREAATAPPAAVPLPKALPVHRQVKAAPTKRPATRLAAKEPARTKLAVAKKSEATTQVAAAKKPEVVKPAAVTMAANTGKPSPAGPLRLVRIGAFASPVDAKLGWRSMVRAYPALAHLPATVVDTGSMRSQGAYRFEIGTASDADSDMICQRMQRLNFPCASVVSSSHTRGAKS